MAVKWTDEQSEAIEKRGKGIIVPAAAGSGKTAVLVERTVRLLEEKDVLPAEKLLAVTFMKDAAAQMKTKLRAALAKRLVGETDPDKREWLARQQDMLALAKICTISSFCYDMVKENLDRFEYRNGITIADDAQMTVLIDECLREVIEEMSAECPERVELMTDALLKNPDGDIGGVILQLYEFKRSLPFPKKWAETAKRLFADEEALKTELQGLFGSVKEMAENAVGMLDEARGTAACLPYPDDIMEKLLEQHDAFGEIRAALTSDDYRRLFLAVTSRGFPKITGAGLSKLKNEDKAEQKRLFGEIKPLSDGAAELFAEIKAAVSPLGDDYIGNSRIAGMAFAALDEAADRLDRRLMERKQELGAAEFGDIERMAMTLLVTDEGGEPKRTELAERIRGEGRYRMLLIDEFQDVNNLQEMIFRALSDTDDLSMLGKNVFVVGDIKQSIYRFRQSNPELFKRAAELAASGKTEQLTEIRLRMNFRSRQSVLAFVNMVFRRIMSQEIGEVEYNEDEQLYCGAKYVGEDTPTEVLLVRDDGSYTDELKYTVFGVEELCAAQRIKQMLDEGTPVNETVKVNGAEVTRQRPCRQSDFCILSRKTETLRSSAAALTYVGLTAHTETEKGYMKSQEIMAMVSLLKVIDNPNRNIPLAAVMLSPIMGFTADGLAKLRMHCFKVSEDGHRNEVRRLYQVLTAVSKSADADAKEAEKLDIRDEELESRCVDAVRLVERLRFYSVSMGIEELITRIYDETGFFAAASGFENSDRRRANLRMLTQRAAEYEAGSTGGIAGFLRFLDSLSEAKGDFKQAAARTTGSDSVTLKTFHRSKGLEYPFVIIEGLGREFNLRDASRNVLLSETGYAGISFYRHDELVTIDTVRHMTLSDKVRSEQLSEEMRLLYVALTRAKEKLIIPLFMKRHAKPQFDVPSRMKAVAESVALMGKVTPSMLADYSCRTPDTWIAAALMLTDGCDALLDEIGADDMTRDMLHRLVPKDDVPAEIVYRVMPEEGGEAVNKAKFAAEKSDSRLVSELSGLFEKVKEESGRETAKPAASKRTVTEIVSEIHMKNSAPEDIEGMFFPQLGTLEKGEVAKLSASQRGTCTHLFMELADYANCEKSVEDELERLVRRGSMTEQEGSGVYISAVKKFFASELYGRMKASAEIEPIMRERRFTVRAKDAGIDGEFAEYIAPDGMLQGICDCIFCEEDGYVLVDYKTDWFRDESELARYDVQLELYRKALELILPKPVKSCCLYSFVLGRAVERLA